MSKNTSEKVNMPFQRQNPGEFPFQYLPTICKKNVLSFLDEKEKIESMRVCKEWDFVMDASLWRHVNLTQFCHSEYMFSSFVSFLESFNCRLKSIKICFNDLKTNTSLNVLLQSEVVSKLESVTIDWDSSLNEDKGLLLTPRKVSNNRREQRRFKDFFSNICTNLPHLTHLITIFDWSLPSFNSLSKLSSLKSLTLNTFPYIITHFDQSLFNSLMHSLPSLEAFSLQMTGTVVCGYETLKISSPSLKNLDLSRCMGVLLTEANLPCIDQLILPPKLDDPSSFNNTLLLPVKPAHQQPLLLNAFGFQEDVIKRVPDNNEENINNQEVLKDIQNTMVSEDALEAFSDAFDGEETINKEHLHHNSSSIQSVLLNLTNKDENVKKSNKNVERKFNKNNNKEKRMMRYRCVSEVLDKGCPSLLKVNGLPVSQLKLNNSNNNLYKMNSDNSVCNDKNKNNGINNKNKNNNSISMVKNGREYGNDLKVGESSNSEKMYVEYKCREKRIIEWTSDSAVDLADYVNLHKNEVNNFCTEVNNSVTNADLKNNANNNNNARIINSVKGFDYTSGAMKNRKFKNSFNLDNYDAAVNSEECVNIKDLDAVMMQENRVEKLPSSSASITFSTEMFTDRVENNKTATWLDNNKNINNCSQNNSSESNCYLRPFCPSSHDQAKQ